MGARSRSTAGLVSLAMLVSLLVAVIAPPAAAQAPSVLRLTRTSWDVIGLKSNLRSNGWESTTPRTFPVSRRVCNTSGSTVTDVSATFTLGTGLDTEIRVPAGWPTTLSAGSLASGACRELTFGVLIGEGHNGHPKGLFGKSREYTVSVSGSGVATEASTGKLYVEKLVAQNRNSTLRVESSACTDGVCAILAGQTYRFTLFSKSAPNGYEQTQSFLTFPLDVFEVLEVQTRYSAPTGATAVGIYGDGCGWGHDASQPTWRTCAGPAKFPGGKVGGTLMRTTYTVRAKTGLNGSESGAIRAVIYDLSGSSYHYNADFATSPAAKTIDTSTAADVGVTLSHTGAFTRDTANSYSVAVRNDGPSATGAPVTVVATLPAGQGVTLVAAPGHFTGTGWSCGRDTDVQATCTHAALASGASAAALTLHVAVAAGAAPSYTATAVVSQSVPDPDTANNTATDVTTTAELAQADLVVANVVAASARRGGTAVYTVSPRNDGPAAVPGPLRVVYTLPAGATFLSEPTGDGWLCRIADQSATCERPEGLAALSAALDITVQATVGQGVLDPMVTTATLYSMGGEPPSDPVPGNNTDVEASLNVAEADLSIDKRNPGQFVITPSGAGSTNTGVFTLTVSNAGPDAAAASVAAPIRVTDVLPIELGYVSAIGAGWSCANAAGTLTCDRVTPLAAGTQAPPITLTMTVPQGLAEGVVLNSASVDGPTEDPDAGDDESDDIALLVNQTDVGITMTGPASVTASGSPGTTTEYLVTVKNHGPATATNVYWQGMTPPGANFEDVVLGVSGNTKANYETVCSVPDPDFTLQGEVTCAVGTLTSGQSAIYRLRVKAISGQTVTPILNTVTTFADQIDTNAANDTVTVETPCTDCVLAPAVTFDNGATAVNEHASTIRTYAFTATHASGITSVTTSCGVGGVKTGGTVSGAAGDVSRTGTVDCVFDDGFLLSGVPGTSVVSVTAVQGTTNSATGTRTVTVSNVAPTATFTAPERAGTSGTFTLSLDGPADASGADTTAGFTYRFDCGSGYGDWSAAASATCTAPGADTTLNVIAQIRDKDELASTYTDTVVVNAPRAQLAITTPVRTTAAGVASDTITVQLQDADGAPQNAGADGQKLYLTSSSLTGSFRTLAGDALDPAEITVPANQNNVSFRYVDTTAGTPVIRVRDQVDVEPDEGTYADVTQPVTVTPGAASIELAGLTDDLLVGAKRVLTVRIVDVNGATVTAGPDSTVSVSFTEASGGGAVTGVPASVNAVAGVATVEVTGSIVGEVSVGASAGLLADDDAADGPLEFNVVAAGVSVAPTALIFPALVPGTASDPLIVTVTNTGTSALTVTGATLSGAHSADFAVVSHTCTALIAPEATCQYSVRFTPGAAGARTGSLDITTDGGNVSVPLAGTGSAPGDGNRAPSISLAVTPDPPKTNDTLTATVTVSDPDDDPLAVTYVWRVNGVTMRTVTGTTALTDTYDLSLPRRGDVNNLITVTATASDGALTASTAKTVRVANSAPTASPRSALVRAVTIGAPADGATVIGLSGVDVDDQTLHYVITDLPGKGTLKVDSDLIEEGELPYVVTKRVDGTDLYPSSVTYVPTPGEAGLDSFAFLVKDTNPVTTLSSAPATVSVGLYTDSLMVSRITTDADKTANSGGDPTLTDPVQALVDARTAGLYVSIEDAPTRGNAAAPSGTYSLLGVEQTLHIKQNDANGDPAVAAADNPFEVTFLLHAGLLPPGLTVNDIVITRNNAAVPECADNPGLPIVEQPCVVSPRVVDGDILRLTVRTLNASNWNFSIPAAPDTAIVQAIQGATNAKAPNDTGAPSAPIKGTLDGFSFSSNDPLASFECRLTRAGGTTAYGTFTACSSGNTSYTITGTEHPDDLYTFEVRAVRDAVVDATPARRDLVVDRTAVSVSVLTGPASPNPTTSGQFTFTADKPGTTFECMLRLQTAVPGGFTPCASPHPRAGLTPGGAYEFNVRGTDEAGNTGTATWLFTVAGGAAPPPPNPPGDDPDDEDPGEDPDDPEGTDPDGPALERISGGDRIGTAAALARKYFTPGLDVVYIARDDDFPDALTATPLAVRDGAPILLVSPGEIPGATAETLRFLRPDRIVILGGVAAVHPDVEEGLGAFATSVERIAGPDRYATAARIAQTLYPDGAPIVFVATGERFADALPAGAAAARAGGPVLLVTSSHVPEVTRAELLRQGAARVVVIGGEGTIPAGVLAEIQSFTSAGVERIAGATRYDTAAAVSAAFFPDPVAAALVATGEDFADALTAGPVGGLLGGPVLLVHPDDLGTAAAEELGRLQPDDVLLLGGEAAVSRRTEDAIRDATGVLG